MTPATLAPETAPILERHAELSALDAVVSGAAGGSGRLAIVEGPAGIGKSTLVRHVVDVAWGARLTVATARATELEQPYAYGIAIGLLEEAMRAVDATDRSALFAGPAGWVAPLFGATSTPGAVTRGSGTPGGSAPTTDASPGLGPDPFATVHGLFWLTANLAERGPLLLAVDDAQWADGASLRFLHYLAQRIDELPVAVVTGIRTGETLAEDEALRHLRATPGAMIVLPAPLSSDAVGQLLTAAGAAGDDPALLEACWQATRGNPFFVTEVVRHVATGSGGLLPRVPDPIARYVDARFARLDAEARSVAEAVAILDSEATVGRVAALAGLTDDEVVTATRRLAAVGILDASPPLAFSHPIVHSEVHASVPAVARGRLHRTAAAILERDQAPIRAVAGQLMVADHAGDPSTVDLLVRAGNEALARGEPEAAAPVLARALAEPPTADRRAEVLIALARAEARSSPGSALAHYAEALDLVTAAGRPELRWELGHVLVWAGRFHDAADAFEQALGELRDPDAPMAGRLEADLVSAAWFAMERRPLAEEIVERLFDLKFLGPGRRELAISIAFQRAIKGDGTAAEGLAAVDRVLGEVPMDVLVAEGQIVEVAAGVMFSTDALERHRDMLTRAIAAAEAAGRYAKIGLYSVGRFWSQYFTGRLTDAIEDAEAGLRAAEVGWETFLPEAWAGLVHAHVERGEVAAAAAAIPAAADDLSDRVDWLVVPIARGRIQLAAGDTGAAVAQLRLAAEFGAKGAFRNPGPPEWRTWLAVALGRAGERDEARAVAADAVEVAQRFGARWPLGRALGVAGLVERGPRGLELLREAADVMVDSPARLERARVLVRFGGALRRAGRVTDARTRLAEGMDLAHRCGAAALVETAHQELLAAGARPRRYRTGGVDALTPAELRVSRLAAGGRTNREIAQLLFVTPKAVEYHLANAYRKLAIESRQALAGVLGDGPGR